MRSKEHHTVALINGVANASSKALIEEMGAAGQWH